MRRRIKGFEKISSFCVLWVSQFFLIEREKRDERTDTQKIMCFSSATISYAKLFFNINLFLVIVLPIRISYLVSFLILTLSNTHAHKNYKKSYVCFFIYAQQVLPSVDYKTLNIFHFFHFTIFRMFVDLYSQLLFYNLKAELFRVTSSLNIIS